MRTRYIVQRVAIMGKKTWAVYDNLEKINCSLHQSRDEARKIAKAMELRRRAERAA